MENENNKDNYTQNQVETADISMTQKRKECLENLT